MNLDVIQLNKEFEKNSAVSLLQWALTTFRKKIAMASSFGAEDVVVIDILMKLDHDVRIFTLDTGRHNE